MLVIKKVIATLMAIAVLVIFVSCREEYPTEFNYHTEIMFGYIRSVVSSEEGIAGLKPSFLEENLTKNVLYLYEDPETGTQEYRRDNKAPEQRCYIIKTQEQWGEIFNEPSTVDFEKQMVVVTFVTVKPGASRLKNVHFKKGKLTIETHMQYSELPKQAPPSWLQSVTVYRMDKIDDASSVEEVFIKKKKI